MLLFSTILWSLCVCYLEKKTKFYYIPFELGYFTDDHLFTIPSLSVNRGQHSLGNQSSEIKKLPPGLKVKQGFVGSGFTFKTCWSPQRCEATHYLCASLSFHLFPINLATCIPKFLVYLSWLQCACVRSRARACMHMCWGGGGSMWGANTSTLGSISNKYWL